MKDCFQSDGENVSVCNGATLVFNGLNSNIYEKSLSTVVLLWYKTLRNINRTTRKKKKKRGVNCGFIQNKYSTVTQ